MDHAASSHGGARDCGIWPRVKVSTTRIAPPHPDAAELILGYSFADIVGRDGIDLKTREMLTVAMLAAMGTAQGQLEFPVV